MSAQTPTATVHDYLSEVRIFANGSPDFAKIASSLGVDATLNTLPGASLVVALRNDSGEAIDSMRVMYAVNKGGKPIPLEFPRLESMNVVNRRFRKCTGRAKCASRRHFSGNPFPTAYRELRDYRPWLSKHVGCAAPLGTGVSHTTAVKISRGFTVIGLDLAEGPSEPYHMGKKPAASTQNRTAAVGMSQELPIVLPEIQRVGSPSRSSLTAMWSTAVPLSVVVAFTSSLPTGFSVRTMPDTSPPEGSSTSAAPSPSQKFDRPASG